MPYAESSGARIYFEEHGSGDPLLLIPGWGCTTTIYQANTPALAKRFRVIVHDPRGAGRSSAGAGGYTMSQYAGDCAAVLDAAGAADAHVLGTSFGGMVAQHVALRHSGRVRRLVLGCTTAGGERHVPPPAENIATFVAAGELDDMAAAVRMRAPLNYSDAYFAGHEDEIIEHALADDEMRQTQEGRLGQLEAVQGHDSYDDLHRISAPTLVAHGSEDGVVPIDNGRALAARIPNARLRPYHGARHVFFVERADEFNRDVIEFLTATDNEVSAK